MSCFVVRPALTSPTRRGNGKWGGWQGGFLEEVAVKVDMESVLGWG